MYRANPKRYFSHGAPFQHGTEQPAMRAETQNIVDEIRQAITLLRRHL
jgi:hypothetical protein